MIKLKEILESNLVRIDKGISSLTGPTVSREQEMIRIPQMNWKQFLEDIKNKISKNKNIPEDKASNLIYGIFGGFHRILTPKMYDILNKMTPIQIETLDFYTDNNAQSIIRRAKELYNDFAETYNAGYGQLRGQTKAKLFTV